MKAVILVAGFGNRMRPLTFDCHKTLLPINGKPILSHIIDSLVEHKVRDIALVTGYKADGIRGFLGAKYPDIKFQYIHNEQYEKTNNIYSLMLALNAIEDEDDIILIESDLVFRPEIIERVIKTPYKNVAVVDKFHSGMDGTVVTVQDKIIREIIPPHLQGSNFDFSDKYKTLNIYKFSKDFWKSNFRKLLNYYTTIIDDNCYYELILGILLYVQKEEIHAEILNGEKWREVDDPNDLAAAEFEFNRSARYDYLQETFGGYWHFDLLDFCFLRNMYFPNDSVLAELRSNVAKLVWNCGSDQKTLNRKLSYFLLCHPDRVVVLNGAAQAFPWLAEFLRAMKILMPAPTFGEYPRMFPNASTYADRPGVTWNAFEVSARSADCIVFVNPNNPTGTFVPSATIHGFI